MKQRTTKTYKMLGSEYHSLTMFTPRSHANPTELKLAGLTCHMIATLVFLNANHTSSNDSN